VCSELHTCSPRYNRARMKRVFLLAMVLACSSAPPVMMETGTRALFDASGDFFDYPYPSDTRLKDGAPDLENFPNSLELQIVSDFKKIGQQRKGFPVLPVAYFHFDGPIAPRDLGNVIPADKSQPLLLVDLETKELTPVVAMTMTPDTYIPEN